MARSAVLGNSNHGKKIMRLLLPYARAMQQLFCDVEAHIQQR